MWHSHARPTCIKHGKYPEQKNIPKISSEYYKNKNTGRYVYNIYNI